MFPSSIKHEIRKFLVVDVQLRQRNVPKSVMHVQSCRFANLTLLLFCRPRSHRRRSCLKGYSQLMLMSIRYHFLTDLHVTRRAWNKSIFWILYRSLVEFNYLQVEIVIIGPKPYQRTHFFIYHWEFTDGCLQGKPNIDEYFRIRTSVEVRNCTKSESLSKVHGR